MAYVKFGDVVRRANTPVDKDNTTLEYYVGGEHVESGEFLVTKCGIIRAVQLVRCFILGLRRGTF